LGLTNPQFLAERRGIFKGLRWLAGRREVEPRFTESEWHGGKKSRMMQEG